MAEENRFEINARADKRFKLVRRLKRLGVPLEVVESYTDSQWAQLAAMCGKYPPSEQTRSEVIAILKNPSKWSGAAA